MLGVIHNIYTLSRKLNSSSEIKPDKNAKPALSSLQPSSALPPILFLLRTCPPLHSYYQETSAYCYSTYPIACFLISNTRPKI